MHLILLGIGQNWTDKILWDIFMPNKINMLAIGTQFASLVLQEKRR